MRKMLDVCEENGIWMQPVKLSMCSVVVVAVFFSPSCSPCESNSLQLLANFTNHLINQTVGSFDI